MDREIVIQLLRGIIPGAFVGFAFALELYRSESSRPADQPSPRQVATPILMALTLVGVFAFAFPLRVPSGLFDWLGWLPVLLALIGAGFVLSPWRIAGALVALFGVALAVLFAPRAEWSGADWKNAFLSVASVVGVGAIFHPAWRNRPLLLLTIATIAAAGISQVLVLGFHTLKLGQVAGIGASVLGGLTVATLLMVWKWRANPHVAPVAAILLLYAVAALAQAPIVTDTKLDWVLLLLLASVPAVATGMMMALTKRRNLILWIGTLLAAGALIVIAMLVVLLTREANPSGY